MRLVIVSLCLLLASAAVSLPGEDVWPARSFVHDGQEREYYLHIPDGIAPEAPLVFALHGLGGRAAKLRYGTELNALADAHGFAVVYPQGLDYKPTSSHWNAGFTFSDVDDVGFLRSLAAHLQARYQLNPAQTFAIGISNGGYMAYHMACHAPGVFDGIAVIAGTMTGDDWGGCDPSEPTPVLHIHGRDDRKIRWDGTFHWMSGGKPSPAVRSLVEYWRRQHGASTLLVEDRRTYDLEKYMARGQEAVWFVAIDEFGHDLPNEENAGFSAMALAWEFFSAL